MALQLLCVLGIVICIGTAKEMVQTLQARRTWGTFTVTSLDCNSRHVCTDVGNWVSDAGTHHFNGVDFYNGPTYAVGRSVRAYARLGSPVPSNTVAVSTSVEWGGLCLLIAVAAFLALLMWMAFRIHKSNLADLEERAARAAARAHA